jgi:hypothetical protein
MQSPLPAQAGSDLKKPWIETPLIESKYYSDLAGWYAKGRFFRRQRFVLIPVVAVCF